MLLVMVIVGITQTMAKKCDLSVNWKYRIVPPAGRSSGVSSALPFPDATHPNSLVFSTGYGVVRLDGAGKELVNFVTTENAMTPAIGDLRGDGKCEIVIPTGPGIIYCIDETGRQLWKTDLADNLYDFGSAVVADIDGDGTMETLLNARAGTLYCLNSDGTLRWKVFAEPRACSPAVGDIDGDGKAEIFYGTDLGKIFCLNYQGRYLWHTEIPEREFGRSAPILADLKGDGKYKLMMPHSNTNPYPAIVVLDAKSGKPDWTGSTVMQNYGGTSIVDLNRDGKLEVIVVDKGNVVNVFDADGKIRWQTTLCGHGTFFAAGVADLFHDGHYELFVGCRGTGPEGQTMFLLDEKGKLLREFKEGTDRESSPMIADLTGDKIPEVYIADGGPEKYMVSYSLEGAKAGGDIPWPCWKRTPSNNGFIPSIHIKGPAKVAVLPDKESNAPLQAVLMGQNLQTIDLPVSCKGIDIMAETRVTRGDHSVASNFSWLENRTNVVKLPYDIRSLEPQEVEFILRDRQSRKIIFHKSVRVGISGYEKDKDFIKAASAEMDKLVKQLPASDLALASDLSARISQMGNAVSGMVPANDGAATESAVRMFENNRNKMTSALKYARFLSEIRQNGRMGKFFVWENPNPWDEVKPEDRYNAGFKADTAQVAVLAMGNETEAISFYLTNLDENAQQVKVYPNDLKSQDGQAYNFQEVAELREAIPTPDSKGMIDEVIPRLNEGNTLYLAPYDNRKLWINLNTKALPPGNYSFLLGFESVGMVESVQTIRVNLRVSSVRVPEKSEFAFNTWSSVSIADETLRKKVVKDLIDHKVTVLPQIGGPRFYLGADGKLGEDWSQFDREITPLKDQMICLLFNPLTIDTKGKELSGDQNALLLKEAYARTSKGMSARGIDRQQWGIYVMDEPGLTGYPSIGAGVRIAKEIRAAAPEVELYIDPAGMVSPQSMKGFEGLIDIYSPQVDLLKDPEGKLLTYFHRLGKRNWFYEAPSPARTFHPLGHYRIQAWLAFDFGFTGSGFYCYHYNGKDNLWRIKSAYPSPLDNYSVIYNDGTNVIPSRRWEACRDGIEDYHLLMMLRRKIAEFKKGSPGQIALAAEAEASMDQIVSRITANVKKIKEINRDFIPYDVDYQLFTEGRRQLVGYLEQMNGMAH